MGNNSALESLFQAGCWGCLQWGNCSHYDNTWEHIFKKRLQSICEVWSCFLGTEQGVWAGIQCAQELYWVGSAQPARKLRKQLACKQQYEKGIMKAVFEFCTITPDTFWGPANPNYEQWSYWHAETTRSSTRWPICGQPTTVWAVTYFCLIHTSMKELHMLFPRSYFLRKNVSPPNPMSAPFSHSWFWCSMEGIVMLIF